MKLIKAHIKNFRLLKDLSLDFSTDDNKPLTVIRAANETGKTTCEFALMWALYGSKKALPSRGDYSLFPVDLKNKGKRKIEVLVEIEFEIDQVISAGRGAQTVERRRYRLVRTCLENANASGLERHEAETLTMYHLRSSGSEPVTELEANRIVEDALPVSLKDVYFTDGDSAMSFIESGATQGVKRQRVSGAVEALLGLENLNTTVKHIDNVAQKFSKEIDNTDYAKELEKLNDQISGFTEDIDRWITEVADLEDQVRNGQREQRTIQTNIDEIVKLGERSDLLDEKQSLERQKSRMQDNIKSGLQSLSRILSNSDSSKAFLSNHVGVALNILQIKKEERELPKANIPILEELLDRDTCLCGTDLSPESDEGKAKRNEIANAIKASQESDAIHEVATDLYYRSRSDDFDSSNGKWLFSYETISKSYQNNRSAFKEMEEKFDKIEEKIDQIEDSKLEELRRQKEQIDNKLTSANAAIASKTTQITTESEKRSDAEARRTRVENQCGKHNSSAGRLTLARHAQALFDRIIEKLKQDELSRVSDEMNRIFLEMIGSDPESNELTLITKTELTAEYDIRVYGPNGNELNPDQDLNGASRRAITLAFILALTKVSEVEAPNIIDTPLGMMSGYVKQSVLRQTLKEGTQIILFLTHDEIKGVENILDESAGKIFTLTNPAHYPRMLKNPQDVKDTRVLRCECSHRETCTVCERKDMGG
ncbi:MAG: AAA family ATPase [Pseudomonadota bacterium]